MQILGISAFYHDSAAALVRDGEIVAAAQEERFTRRKHDPAFPSHAISYCLSEGRISPGDLDYIVFYEKPFLKLERLLETWLAFAPRGFSSFRLAMPLWAREKLFQRKRLGDGLKLLGKNFDWERRLLFTEHHRSHAASAFFPSPFPRAAILTVDGVGEWTTTSTAIGNGNRIETLNEIFFPHSLGLLYSAFTYYLGFKVNSGEYKLMGLAPYGSPRYAGLILEHLIDLKDDGSYRLNQKYFDYCTGLRMTNGRFNALFHSEPRRPGDAISAFHMDLAASIQAVLEEALLRLTRFLARQTGAESLCLAGGVALNCAANGRIFRDGRFQNIWIQPAAGDAGGALGAALSAYYEYAGRPRMPSGGVDSLKGAYLGPEFHQNEIESCLLAAGARFESLETDVLLGRCVETLMEGKALGWFQGRMEFGPRALGARSILADPRSPTMQSLLNLKIKNRESFRPFAPSILKEDVTSWFDTNVDSPYMLINANVRESRRHVLTKEESRLPGLEKLKVRRSDIPAVTHVDYSSRIQTVERETNPRYHDLITRFKQSTDCPLLLNTSFNVRGEPMVCTPEDAFRCFMSTEIESLAIGNCFLRKEDQTVTPGAGGMTAFEPD